MHSKHRVRLAAVLLLALAGSITGCSLFASKANTPTRVITSPLDTSRYFARNVSLLKGFDRVTTINLATSFSWWDSTGKVREMRDNFGEVMAIYFYGPAHAPSLKTATELMKAKQVLRDSDVVYLGITSGERVFDSTTVWNTQRITDSLGLDFQQIIGNTELNYAYGGINAWPTLFVISRNGKIHQTLQGPQTAQQIEAAIRKTLTYVPLR